MKTGSDFAWLTFLLQPWFMQAHLDTDTNAHCNIPSMVCVAREGVASGAVERARLLRDRQQIREG
jgi:hypothetical protein